MNIKISYILLGIISIIIITVGLILYAGDNAESIPKSRSAKVDYEKLDDVIFNVKTNQAFIGDLIKTTNANGTVRPVNEIDVASNISSTVEKINIYEGKRVRKGDLLIKLDDREYKINLDEAEDKLIEAKVEYYFLTKDSPVVKDVDGEAAVIENEIEQLEGEYQRGIISDDRFQEVKDSLDLKLIFSGGRKEELILNKSGINRAKNQKERALLNIEHTNLIAPFSGIIGDFNLSVGQRISSGETLFKLIDDSELLIDVGILESEIPSIELGNFAEIELSALPGEKFEGSVIYISPFVDAETKTCKVTIKLENPTKKIKPGM
ncbi:MAG: efflux RND transporter periplasmic adaptor subunit, partial [Melioribacteraceae bacterium]|nr:efflux RND transporter periplasmic adaptor subunit [Melioribacteraceae bacterium]